MKDEERGEPLVRIRWWMSEALIGVLCSIGFAILFVYSCITWLAFEGSVGETIVPGVAGLATVTYTGYDLLRQRRRQTQFIHLSSDLNPDSTAPGAVRFGVVARAEDGVPANHRAAVAKRVIHEWDAQIKAHFQQTSEVLAAGTRVSRTDAVRIHFQGPGFLPIFRLEHQQGVERSRLLEQTASMLGLSPANPRELDALLELHEWLRISACDYGRSGLPRRSPDEVRVRIENALIRLQIEHPALE